MELLLSKSTTPIIGWIAWILGWMMNGIYEVLNMLHIPNIGVAIIIYTIIVYMLMIPLQIKQQKMSKMMSVVQPELTAIQNKYRSRRDSASQQKMQEETMAVYDKYGYSPTGSCLPLVIQLPLLFALYQVIYRIPGYVTRVYNIFNELAVQMQTILHTDNIVESKLIQDFIADNKMRTTFIKNSVDFLYQLKPSQWTEISKMKEFSGLTDLINNTAAQSQKINSFLNINISESPWDALKSGLASHSVGIIVVAAAIPILAWFTQWLNYKLMPQSNSQAAGNDSMAGTMKTMNTTMPIFSAFICMTLSMGIGIYWISGAVIRCIQQVVINRRIMNMDVDDMIEKAREKKAKKDAKKNAKNGTPDRSHVNQQANARIKRIQADAKKIDTSNMYSEEKQYRPDSIAARANMVNNYNKKNSKKK